MWPIRSTSTTSALVLGAPVALPPSGIRMFPLGLAAIALSRHTSVTSAGAALSLFMVGCATGPVLFAPVSDGLERRPVLLLARDAVRGRGSLGPRRFTPIFVEGRRRFHKILAQVPSNMRWPLAKALDVPRRSMHEIQIFVTRGFALGASFMT